MIEPTLPPDVHLAPLETFDSDAFIDSDPAVQQVCDFVLALSLLFGDLNDLILAHHLLRKGQPNISEFFKSPKWGMYNGLDIHFFRRKVATLHELSVLIAASKKEVSHPIFRSVLSKLSKLDDRFSWEAVSNPPKPLADFLANVRDKVSNHYFHKDNRGQSVIGQGYRKFFGASKATPFISYGKDSLNTRFYFVDAAVQGLLELKDWRSVDSDLTLHMSNVCRGLSGVTLAFLIERGCKLVPVAAADK